MFGISADSKERIAKILLVLGALGFLYIIIRGQIFDPRELKEHGRYTVVITGESYFKLKSGMQVRYHYFVNGKRYSDSQNLNDHIRPNGKYYLIVFSSKNPSIHRWVCFDLVPEEFIEPPAEGWNSPPFQCSFNGRGWK